MNVRHPLLAVLVCVLMGALGVGVALFADRAIAPGGGADGDPRKASDNSTNGAAAAQVVAVKVKGLRPFGSDLGGVDATNLRTNRVAAAESQDNEQLMTEVVNGLLDELLAAARAHDVKRLGELIEKLRSLQYGAKFSSVGSSRLASFAKRKALVALEEAGYDGLLGVIDLLADADPVVASSATELLFKALSDFSLSDYQRADAVTAAAEEMTDEMALNRLFAEFIKMRHSVGTAALVQIDASGTEEARKILPRVISAFAGDVSIATAQQLQGLMDSGGLPDGPYDNWFYGHEKLTHERK